MCVDIKDDMSVSITSGKGMYNYYNFDSVFGPDST